jgi:hypothetical protein
LLEDIDATLTGSTPIRATAAAGERTARLPDLQAVGATTVLTPTVRRSGRRLFAAAGLFVAAATIAIAGWWLLREPATLEPALVAESQSSPTTPAEALEPPLIVPVEANSAPDANAPAGAGPEVAAVATTAQNGLAPDTVPLEPAVTVTLPATEVEVPRAGAIREHAAPPPNRHDPGVVVVAAGLPEVTATVEAVLEGALAGADIRLLDEQLFDGMTVTDAASLAREARANGADILVIAEVSGTGSRELQFYGRTEHQQSARIIVRATLLAERRTLGAPWQQTLQFVPLNADQETRTATEPIARELVARIANYKIGS